MVLNCHPSMPCFCTDSFTNFPRLCTEIRMSIGACEGFRGTYSAYCSISLAHCVTCLSLGPHLLAWIAFPPNSSNPANVNSKCSCKKLSLEYSPNLRSRLHHLSIRNTCCIKHGLNGLLERPADLKQASYLCTREVMT
jgi:hypothetical protein